MLYVNFSNLDAGFLRPYQKGDRLVRGWSGEVTSALPVVATGSAFECERFTAERVFRLHNADGRPDAQLCPSLSVGDVVLLGDVALSVAVTGFEVVELDPADLITDRSWREVLAGG